MQPVIKITDQDRLKRLAEYRKNLWVDRAKVASLLGYSWAYVDRTLLDYFEVREQCGQILVSLSSVELWLRQRKLKFPRSARQLHR